MQPQDNIDEKVHGIAANIILGFIALVILYLLLCIPVHIHGYYRDHFVHYLEDDCWMCDLYRYWMRDDTAFQIRELYRNGSR